MFVAPRTVFFRVFTLLIAGASLGCAHTGASNQITEAPKAASPLAGAWIDLETNSVLTIAEQGGKLRVVSVVAQDGEDYPITQQEQRGGDLAFTYHVPSTGYDVTIITKGVEGNTLKSTWANANASGEQDFERAPAPTP